MANRNKDPNDWDNRYQDYSRHDLIEKIKQYHDMYWELRESREARQIMVMQDAVKECEQIIAICAPFKVVQGDEMKFDNPNSNINLNSSTSWIVCAKDKTAHRVRVMCDKLNAIASRMNPTPTSKE